MTTRAYAKINLDLRLGRRRPDGFHPIDSFFIRVDLFDTLDAELTSDGQCTLVVEGDSKLSHGSDNLVLRAAQLLQKQAAKGLGVRLHLKKDIPQGAGLGGGSSDAASTLLLLRNLWSISCTDEELSRLGGELGSDVPFFLQPYAARATGRGEIIQPVHLKDLPWAILIHPGFPSPTAAAYAAYAKSPIPCSEGPPLHLTQGDGSKLTLHPRNDLEGPVENKFIWIRSAREWLQKQSGSLAARMSGSGSTVFGLFHSQREVDQIVSLAKSYFGSEAWIQSARLKSGTD
jgi:4-diphosphocytidyl-2-C-methyl-D-erythritol kinase